jgi:hypothetical protein
LEAGSCLGWVDFAPGTAVPPICGRLFFAERFFLLEAGAACTCCCCVLSAEVDNFGVFSSLAIPLSLLG